MWKFVIKPALIILAYVATIVSALYLFVSDETAIIVALLVFCLSTIGFFVYLAWVINKQLKNNVYPYITNTNFLKWEFGEDGKKSTLEIYRHIQCKKSFLAELDWEFKWSGTRTPLITSKFQHVLPHIKNGHLNEYDSVRLRLKKPIFYNDTEVLHFHAELDDVDDMARPYAVFKVDKPINLLQFRIILKHKKAEFSESATFIRKPIGNNSPYKEEMIESIPFNATCKCYEYHLLNPEVGYYYMIQWVK